MKLDPRIKIKKHKDYPIGIVIDAPKEYLGVYCINDKGSVKFIELNKKKALNYLTSWINSRSYLFEEEE